MQHMGSCMSYSQHWAQYLLKTVVKFDVVSLNRQTTFEMSDICIRDHNEYFTIKPTHDRQFEKPLSCLNYLKMSLAGAAGIGLSHGRSEG
jgi:hypothetical protein